jgi:hypothetical protein
MMMITTAATSSSTNTNCRWGTPPSNSTLLQTVNLKKKKNTFKEKQGK